MPKDPRFNFYPDNWDGGTEDFSLEQEGAYLRLIILQSRKGRFTQQQAMDTLMSSTRGDAAACTKLWNFLMPKFENDGTLFWSPRLEKEVAKSRHHSEKQKERADERWKRTKEKNGTAAAYAKGNATAQALPDNRTGSGNRTGIDLRVEGPGEGNQETLEVRLAGALDGITLDTIRMKAPSVYPGVDIDQEIERFRLKVTGSPSVYADRDVGSLRMALFSHLRFAKTPASTGKPARIKSFNIDEV